MTTTATPPTNLTILALDMASTTGWALYEPDREVLFGHATFRRQRGETNGIRFLRFRRWLQEIFESAGFGKVPGLVAYERPHHRGGAATDLLVGLQAVLQEEAAVWELEVFPKHSAEIKRHATGKGNAKKAAVLAAARV